jgi:hypothetical protein
LYASLTKIHTERKKTKQTKTNKTSLRCSSTLALQDSCRRQHSQRSSRSHSVRATFTRQTRFICFKPRCFVVFVVFFRLVGGMLRSSQNAASSAATKFGVASSSSTLLAPKTTTSLTNQSLVLRIVAVVFVVHCRRFEWIACHWAMFLQLSLNSNPTSGT